MNAEKLFFNADLRKSNADKRRRRCEEPCRRQGDEAISKDEIASLTSSRTLLAKCGTSFARNDICDHLRAICENLRSRKVFHCSYKGLTLMEVLISILLLSVIFLAVTGIFYASHRFFLTANSKAILQSELGYALDHMQKNIIQGVGDKSDPALISPSSDTLQIRIDSTLVSYTRSLDGKLIYNNGSSDESLCADSINVTNLTFSLENNFLVNIQISGSRTFGDRTESLILYTTVFPRLMSNN